MIFRFFTSGFSGERKLQQHGRPTCLEADILRVIGAGVALLIWLIVPSGTHAAQPLAEKYPIKPIRFVVPFAPGGGTDIIARIIAQGLTEEFGQAFVVDNRPGAGGVIGTEIVAKAVPDGYTLLLGNISVAFNVGLYKSLPFDTAKDLRGITLVADAPNLLVVTSKLPVSSFKEFVAYARANPGKIAYGSGGVGTGVHLATELLGKELKVSLLHIPYKGTGLAMTDVISGQIQMMLSTFAPALPQAKLGRLRAIAVTGRKRSSTMPEVPTIAESGLPEYEYTTWYALLASAALPNPVVRRIFEGVRLVSASPDIGKKLQEQGVDPTISASPEAFNNYVQQEIKKWARAMRNANIPQQ